MRVMTTGIIFCTKTYNLNSIYSLTQEFGVSQSMTWSSVRSTAFSLETVSMLSTDFLKFLLFQIGRKQEN